MATLKFTKMQGLGNDFIVIDDLGSLHATSGDLSTSIAVKICDRRFGVGADQILWLRKPLDSSLDARMEILNADGSTAEMCGNGIRAVALYLNRAHYPGKTEFKVETLAGIKLLQIHGSSVIVDMGVPVLGDAAQKGGESLVGLELSKFIEVNVGNPHAVFFVEKASIELAEKWGPLVEKHSRFPNRTNVEFVEIKSPHAIQVRVWERGAGITLACGTGACASAIASLATGRVQSPVEVQLLGGNLKITWAGPGSSVMMEGPAEEVFKGEISI